MIYRVSFVILFFIKVLFFLKILNFIFLEVFVVCIVLEVNKDLDGIIYIFVDLIIYDSIIDFVIFVINGNIMEVR